MWAECFFHFEKLPQLVGRIASRIQGKASFSQARLLLLSPLFSCCRSHQSLDFVTPKIWKCKGEGQSSHSASIKIWYVHRDRNSKSAYTWRCRPRHSHRREALHPRRHNSANCRETTCTKSQAACEIYKESIICGCGTSAVSNGSRRRASFFSQAAIRAIDKHKLIGILTSMTRIGEGFGERP